MKKIVFSVVILMAFAVVSCKEKPGPDNGGDNGGGNQPDTGAVVASDYVDLGLISKTLWATCNVGASSPEKRGNLYAWGEIAVKDDYKWNTYIDPYDTILPDDIASTQYDVAHVKLGGGCHIPTKEQMEELMTSCTWQGGRVNGVTGYNVIGPNGNFIFLPFTGFKQGSSIQYEDYGHYWTSEKYDKNDAYMLDICGAEDKMDNRSRYMGRAVRPVKSK